MIIQSNKPNINSPSFQQKIVISPSQFNRLPLVSLIKQRKYSGFPWTINEAVRGTEGFTALAASCTIAYIKPFAGTEGFLTHLKPLNMKLDEIEEKLAEIVRQFSSAPDNPGGKLSGILIGGRNSGHVRSNSLYNSLKRLYEKFNIEFSAILGTNRHTTVDLYFSATADEAVININQMGCEKPLRTIEDLQKAYDIVEINPKDRIIFE